MPLRRNSYFMLLVLALVMLLFFMVFVDFSHYSNKNDLRSQEERKFLKDAVFKQSASYSNDEVILRQDIQSMVKENREIVDKLQHQLDNSREFYIDKFKSNLGINDTVKINKPQATVKSKRLALSKPKPLPDGQKEKGITYVKHPPVSANKLKGVKVHLLGYYKLSMHYKWAVTKAFETFSNATSLIIVEDDLEVAVDFFSYFRAMHDVLLKDMTIWCASAWNDNGKEGIIDESFEGAKKLYRTDFFPGLGWMLTKSLWKGELESKWPDAFWDDWMRSKDQRKGRVCIRPEISRTITFGKKGVSNGQFFEKHLKYIKLNPHDIDWSKEDLSYLLKPNYDREYLQHVKNLPVRSVNDLKGDEKEIRLEYKTEAEFKSLAMKFGLMLDFKDGVPRTAYQGIVTSLYNNKRIFLTPPNDWKGYTNS